MRLLSAGDLARALPVPVALEAAHGAFVAISGDGFSVAERQALPLPGGTGLVMGAAAPGLGFAGKLVSVMPGNTELGLPGTLGLLVLMDGDRGAPLALMDGAAFTARRTAAMTACATRLLAREDARVGVLVGCGAQASALVEALDGAVDLEELRIVGRTRRAAERFIAGLERPCGTSMRAMPDATSALRGAHIVVTATNASTPVFAVEAVAPGTHISAIGSFRPGMCEFDPSMAARARVFVESRSTARVEAGELTEAIERGLTTVEAWTEVGEVLDQRAEGRRDAEEITLFKSVGHAVFDLFAARAAYECAERENLGVRWNP